MSKSRTILINKCIDVTKSHWMCRNAIIIRGTKKSIDSTSEQVINSILRHKMSTPVPRKYFVIEFKWVLKETLHTRMSSVSCQTLSRLYCIAYLSIVFLRIKQWPEKSVGFQHCCWHLLKQMKRRLMKSGVDLAFRSLFNLKWKRSSLSSHFSLNKKNDKLTL